MAWDQVNRLSWKDKLFTRSIILVVILTNCHCCHYMGELLHTRQKKYVINYIPKLELTYICMLVNSLWPSNAIRRQRSGSTLAEVMACCLTAPSHYLNQCWLIIIEVQWNSYPGNFARDASTLNHWKMFENYMFKNSFKFPRRQWVNGTT